MKVSVTANFSGITQQLGAMGKQVAFASAVALTRTAQQAKEALEKEMASVFDRPTPYTMKSLRLRSAKTTKLEAFVWLKDDAGKGTPADKYLLPQINGGVRALKRFEQALQAVGAMPRGYVAIPAAGAQLDAYGNVKRSQIVQIMSQLKAQRGGGYQSRASDSKRSKRTVAKQGVIYMALPKRHKGLAAGVWAKIVFAHGTTVKPVFIFASAANYKPLFKFEQIAKEVVDKNLVANFDAALAKALATAR